MFQLFFLFLVKAKKQKKIIHFMNKKKAEKLQFDYRSEEKRRKNQSKAISSKIQLVVFTALNTMRKKYPEQFTVEMR